MTQPNDQTPIKLCFMTQPNNLTPLKLCFMTQPNDQTPIKLCFMTQPNDQTPIKLCFMTQPNDQTPIKLCFMTQPNDQTPIKLCFMTQPNDQTPLKLCFMTQPNDQTPIKIMFHDTANWSNSNEILPTFLFFFYSWCLDCVTSNPAQVWDGSNQISLHPWGRHLVVVRQQTLSSGDWQPGNKGSSLQENFVHLIITLVLFHFSLLHRIWIWVLVSQCCYESEFRTAGKKKKATKDKEMKYEKQCSCFIRRAKMLFVKPEWGFVTFDGITIT